MTVANPISQHLPQGFHAAGVAPRPVQLDYANRVGAALALPDPVTGEHGFVTSLRADTGVGKSLAYLLACALNAVLTNERIMVATYRVGLIDDLMRREVPRVTKAVAAITGRTVTFARRLGRAQFIDAERILSLQQEWRRAGASKTELAVLDGWFNYTVEPSSEGTFIDAMENAGLELPVGLRREDICLRSASPNQEKYRTHCDEATAADVILTTHAMAILDALRGGDLLAGPIGLRVAIFDEADRLLDAADSVCVYRQRLSEAVRTADEEDDKAQGARLRALEEVARLILRQAGDRKAVVIDPNNPEHRALIEQVEQCKDALPESRRWVRSARHDGPIKALIEDSKDSVALTATGRHPARVARQLWKDGRYLRSVIFTSATGLDMLLREVDVHAHRLSGEFAPDRFGALQFVLAGDDAPAPVSDSEVSPAWRGYVVERLREVRSVGGRALVLVASYADADALAGSLTEIGHLLVHRRGQLLQSLLPAFKEQPQAMLITPAGWEGLDLPGLIDHLVIARIPFSPPDWARAALTSQGAAMAYNVARAKAKVTQGIGRALRQESDNATVWILDRRFPLPRSALRDIRRRIYGAGISQLRSAIPERFSRGPGSAYERARCLGERTSDKRHAAV